MTWEKYISQKKIKSSNMASRRKELGLEKTNQSVFFAWNETSINLQTQLHHWPQVRTQRTVWYPNGTEHHEAPLALSQLTHELLWKDPVAPTHLFWKNP
jgi:hypothetical protein